MRRPSFAAAPKRACCGSCSRGRGGARSRAVAVALDGRRPPGGAAERPHPAGAGGPLRPRGGGRDPREGGLLRRARPLDRHLPRAGAHVLQGHGAPGRGRDRPRDQERGRLSQRQHDVRPHLVFHRPSRRQSRRGARHPGRCAPPLGHRRERAGPRAPGHHPGSQAQARFAVVGGVRDAARGDVRPPPDPALADRPRGAARGVHPCRRPRLLRVPLRAGADHRGDRRRGGSGARARAGARGLRPTGRPPPARSTPRRRSRIGARYGRARFAAT